ncbi:MAG: UMP kinase [Candidatus Bathyarchaeota archaeon]|nr:MAG: UMP kinase [Candidatus Bathyarchaeota archaeon]
MIIINVDELGRKLNLKIVIKIGGHLFSSKLCAKEIEAYSRLLQKLHNEGYGLVVVVGGGAEARRYIQVAKKLGGSETICDLLGIAVSRIHARLLITSLNDVAFPEVPTTIEELRTCFATGRMVIMGGTQPGQSTNAVGILAAEAIGADMFINATDVDGVYTSDPKKDPHAKKLDKITTDQLFAVIQTNKLEAGSYALFDPIAIKIVERSGIATRIVDGRKPINIERAVKGDAVGTLIISAMENHR